ncbi:hypothetical protein KUTeg_020111 [Tegillarca granosa]|uniref:pyridoxal 5'-phosphate synthase n=1 Tax=Tegillarca granosa TaxID=220873 RepID=A0ABQ9E9K9_TEGGR|nr:hypothetical protein KUTeg_020111 [Tegillarca granosa]
MQHNAETNMRVPYRSSSDIFDIKNLASTDPFKQFDNWFNEACNTKGIAEANAMALGTCSKDGTPTVSMVLLKGYDEEGFRFFTNYESRKGRDLIRIEGNAEKLPEQESMDYYHSRPRNSQIGVIISHKSYVIPDREVLYENFAKLQEEYKDEHKNIPKPSFWGGFRVKPRTFEFWQGQTNRLHDRIKFRKPKEGEEFDPKLTHKGENGWVFERLSP